MERFLLDLLVPFHILHYFVLYFQLSVGVRVFGGGYVGWYVGEREWVFIPFLTPT